MTRFLDEEVSYFDKGVDELKRVDHLIYVSLKYTRTVDVIKNTINRMIACFDHVIEGLLKVAEDRGQIFEMPSAPGARVNEVKRLYPNDELIKEMLNFYSYLRKVHNAEYEASREFRRHVTMTAKMQDGSIEEVNIDRITEHYFKCKQLMVEFRKYFYHDQ
jgi:hypothetical protein